MRLASLTQRLITTGCFLKHRRQVPSPLTPPLDPAGRDQPPEATGFSVLPPAWDVTRVRLQRLARPTRHRNSSDELPCPHGTDRLRSSRDVAWARPPSPAQHPVIRRFRKLLLAPIRDVIHAHLARMARARSSSSRLPSSSNIAIAASMSSSALSSSPRAA